MKNKIMLRLSLYFFVSFIIFSIIISTMFSVLFSRHNIEVHKAELEEHATSVADILSETMFITTDPRQRGQCHCMVIMEFNTYIRFIEEIIVCNMWIVDRDLEQITINYNPHNARQMHIPFNPGELPEYAEQVIFDAFNGKSQVNEIFSEFFGMPAITAAAPIILNNEIIGAVLLHSYVSNIDIINTEGMQILMYSLAGAIFASVFIAFMLSLRFTSPLNKIKKAAVQIGSGNYTAKTNVNRSDEIGELAGVLDDLAVKLDDASKESTKLENLRRDFVANVSHELRTPITVIRGSLEALCDGVVTDKVKVEQYHSQMLNETMHLERLVTDLLDLSRLQNPDFYIEMQEINIKDIVNDAVISMTCLAKQKGISIECASDDYLFTGDYVRLRQMLIILLDNAIKFSHSNDNIIVRLTGNKIQIIDKGIGIADSDIPFIFDRFYKQRSEENKTGSGLGLAIAKQIADRHGISIDINSKQGEGTGVTLGFLYAFQ